jgi:hypothetical protein
MKAEKYSLDLEKYYETIAERYLRLLKCLFEKNFRISSNKERFIKDCESKIALRQLLFTNDLISRNLIEIWCEFRNLKRPMNEILAALRDTMKLWENSEFKNAIDVPIYKFASNSSDTEIINWITRYSVALAFGNVVLAKKLKKIKPQPVQGGLIKKKTEKNRIFYFEFRDKRNSEERLVKIYNWLCKEEYLEKKGTSLKMFKDAFQGSQIRNQIIWRGTPGELAYFLDALSRRLFLLRGNLEKLFNLKNPNAAERKAISTWINPRLIATFLSNDGTSFSSRAITKARDNYRNNFKKRPLRGAEIDDFIASI